MKVRRFLLVCLSLFLPYAGMAQAVEKEAEDEELPASPLVVENAEELENFAVYSIQQIPFVIQLKNTAQTPVEIRTLRVNCSCLELKTKMEDVTVAPNGSLPVSMNLVGKNLKPGRFDRFMLLDAKGYKVSRIHLAGYQRPLFDVQPSQALDLGTFVGDVPWKRTISIRSMAKGIELELPPQNEKEAEESPFQYRLTRKTEYLHEIEFSPKSLPMKRGKLQSAISLHVRGEGMDGRISVGVVGRVTGHRFMLERREFTVHASKENLKGELVFLNRIIPVADTSRHANTYYQPRRNEKNTSIFPQQIMTYWPVTLEENAVSGYFRQATWEKLIPDFHVKISDESLKATLRPLVHSAEVEVVFPPNYFKADKASQVKMEFFYKEASIGTVIVNQYDDPALRQEVYEIIEE